MDFHIQSAALKNKKAPAVSNIDLKRKVPVVCSAACDRGTGSKGYDV